MPVSEWLSSALFWLWAWPAGYSPLSIFIARFCLVFCCGIWLIESSVWNATAYPAHPTAAEAAEIPVRQIYFLAPKPVAQKIETPNLISCKKRWKPKDKNIIYSLDWGLNFQQFANHPGESESQPLRANKIESKNSRFLVSGASGPIKMFSLLVAKKKSQKKYEKINKQTRQTKQTKSSSKEILGRVY